MGEGFLFVFPSLLLFLTHEIDKFVDVWRSERGLFALALHACSIGQSEWRIASHLKRGWGYKAVLVGQSDNKGVRGEDLQHT